MPEPLDPSAYREIVRQALSEDVGAGDITTTAIVSPRLRAEAVIQAKSTCVMAGIDVAREVFAQVDAAIAFVAIRRDGDACRHGDRLAHLNGPAAGVLTAERTALNLLQRLSGIATRTREFVDAAGGHLSILDTRKTTPTFRAMEKYAVRCGGGVNHRIGLYDGILIKDNHIRVAGGVAEAVRRARATGASRTIEVEAQTDAEVDAAIAAGVDIIMLDNMTDDRIRAAIARIGGRARVELSGNMTVDRVRTISTIGADYVSIGALTHSAPAVDLSLEVERLIEEN